MWTKSRKISAAVLGLAAVAFGVDRFVLSSGKGAGADAAASEYAVSRSSSPASAATTAAAQPKQDRPAASAASTAVTLASRLSAMAEARRFQYETSGDAFRPSDAWLISAAPPAPVLKATSNSESSGAPKAARVDPVAAFAKRHTLTAIMTKRNGGMAIVDGKLYAPGQAIDGFKLMKVSETEATFTANGRTATLKLPGQTVASAR